ncbi:MAG TPA: monofunctional biosynthetic peptidoglycan transglycosylase [Thermoanaerobaculia bacterium]
MFKKISLAVLLLLVAWLAFEWIRFPNVKKLATSEPETTAFMERRKELLRSRGQSDELEWRWVPYERISSNLRRGVLVAEDSSFYEHEGVDHKAMREAFERNLKRKKVTHGGSTITQQLAKNLYLSPSRNPLRKVREYLIARSMERNLSKKRILEIYLNVVEFGERVYGAEAAARHYFGKPAASLTLREAALLAGSLPNPRVMNPGNPNKRLRSRQQMIMSRMKRWGYLLEQDVLTEKKPAAAAEEPPPEPESTEIPDEMTDQELAPLDPEPVSEEPLVEQPPIEETPEQPPVPETSPPPPTNT